MKKCLSLVSLLFGTFDFLAQSRYEIEMPLFARAKRTHLRFFLAFIFFLVTSFNSSFNEASAAGFCETLFLNMGAQGASEHEGDWKNYAGGPEGLGHSPLTGIGKDNIDQLHVIARIPSPDTEIVSNTGMQIGPNEGRPLAIAGDLFLTTSFGIVTKVDGVTLKPLWTFDPKSYEEGSYPPNLGFIQRGLTYWTDGKGDRRIYYANGKGYLIALNADTGMPVSSFGKSGKIDLLQALNADGTDWPNRLQYGVSSPPVIIRGQIIVGSSIDDITKTASNPPGDVRAFDVITGRLVWRFTAQVNGSGQANVWTTMSHNGRYVFLPTSTPTDDFLGTRRLGDDLYGESIVCIDCKRGGPTEKTPKWYYQLVHHGLWDYDLPTHPILIQVPFKGKNGKKRTRRLVVQVTKQGMVYVFDQKSGKPLWPIIETAVPGSNVAGESSSPTQPIPSNPPPFGRLGSGGPYFSPEAAKVAAQYTTGPLYTPPSVVGEVQLPNGGTKKNLGTLTAPGTVGGASWAGAVYNPSLNLLIVTSVVDPRVHGINVGPDGTKAYNWAGQTVKDTEGKPYKRPLFEPPFGSITAYKMTTGKILWQVPMGRGPIDDPYIQESLRGTAWEGKDTGWNRRGHPLSLPDLLLVGQSGDQSVSGTPKEMNGVHVAITETPRDRILMAYDPNTGALIREIDLMEGAPQDASGTAQGGMMTFINQQGKQLVVVPVGGANLKPEWVVLGLSAKP